MKEYFDRINRLIDLGKLPSRVKFKLQDLCELRKNAWVPRREENNPKTIDQIRREVQMEEISRQQAVRRQQREQAAQPMRQERAREQAGQVHAFLQRMRRMCDTQGN